MEDSNTPFWDVDVQELDFVAGEDAFSTLGKIADDTPKLRYDRSDRRLILSTTSLSACDLCHFPSHLSHESRRIRERKKGILSVTVQYLARARAHEHNLELFSEDSEKEQQVRIFQSQLLLLFFFPKESLKLHFLYVENDI